MYEDSLLIKGKNNNFGNYYAFMSLKMKYKNVQFGISQIYVSVAASVAICIIAFVTLLRIHVGIIYIGGIIVRYSKNDNG